jgi:dihydrolipoamide dehydrogenase
VAVGRRPCTEGAGLEEAGVELTDNGFVKIDEHFRTSVAGVYAIGDLVPGPMLAHKAEDEGVAVAEILAGHPGHINYDTIPSVVYTDPELAQVGLTEAQLKEQGVAFNTGRFMFRANGRAKSLGQQDGMVKILAHKETDKILGVHMVGPRVSELIAEAVVAMEFAASAEDLARTVHAHPTLAEVVKEAALAVDKRAIHG